MATTTNRAAGLFLGSDLSDADPFVSPVPEARRQRYSGFDNQYMSLYSTGSPSQAKKALEAHLAETERRIHEASQLGSVLSTQREELSAQLKEVNKHQDDVEIGPELKQKLLDLEREYNEVGKETARAFIPRSRVPSNEAAPDGSSTLYSAEAQHSPSKIHAPLSRKQRNQGPSRVNDIQLATEISSSLLNQVRELQTAYAEKDEALKATLAERSQLELERESLLQRVRNLDESEQRYKDENWSLETQLHEHIAAQKEAAEKEQKLTQGLNLARSERTAIERELEELKQVHGKLSDELATTKRHTESELSTLRRHVDLGESDRSLLQRKIEELTSQNQELAKAMAYRLRQDQADSDNPALEENEELAPARFTPEHSPPPSPTKATPRHGHLESETLKSSLNHAYRMIQNLKNNIHREKTEKMELKRMLQDARDELEVRRGENGLNSAGKKRKPTAVDAFKKPPRPDRLGLARGTRDEIIIDDPDWEEHDGEASPTRKGKAIVRATTDDDTSTDAFETATEHSEAFETANELDGTETEAFQTGVESLDGASSDDLTETEATGSGLATSIRSRKITPLALSKPGNRSSYLSTASTSGDEFDDMSVRTPVQTQRYRLKMNRPGLQKSRESFATIRDSPVYRDSPASVASTRSAHSAPGQNLLAELGNLSDEDSDDLDMDNTPSRSSFLAPALESPVRPQLKMIDSSTGTDSPKPAAQMSEAGIMTDVVPQPEPVKLEIVSMVAVDYAPVEPEVPSVVVPQLTSTIVQAVETTPVEPEIIPVVLPELSSTVVSFVDTEPLEPAVIPVVPPMLSSTVVSSVQTEPVEPVSIPEVLPTLSATVVSSVHTEPIEPQSSPVAIPEFSSSTIQTVETEPVEPAPMERAAPIVPIPVPVALPTFSSSTIQSVHTEPTDLVERAAPVTPPVPVELPKFSSTSIQSVHTEPVEPVVPAPVPVELPKFASTSIQSVHTEPVEPQIAPVQLPTLTSTMIQSVQTEPKDPVIPPPPAPSKFSLSSLSTLHTAPVEPPAVLPPFLGVSSFTSQGTHPEPFVLPPAPLPVLARPPPSAVSGVYSQEVEPVEPERPTTAKRIITADTAMNTEDQSSSKGKAMAGGVLALSSVGAGSSLLGRIRGVDGEPHIVEDETSQPSRAVDENTNPSQTIKSHNGRVPFQDIDPNAGLVERTSSRESAKPVRAKTTDEGTQTQVSSSDIDRMLAAKAVAINISRGSPNKAMASPVIPMFGSVSPRKSREFNESKTTRRPGSSSSLRSRAADAPPLPSDHKEAIAAATQRTSTSTPPMQVTSPGIMGPPIMPASAYKAAQIRPRTPSLSQAPPGSRGGTTPRPNPAQSHRSGVSSPVTTRRSSVSSFASELDQRFNIQHNAPGLPPDMMDLGTDPRMIQAITQTMIGEYLWKYTRKAGSESMSENRHRRYFWVHPYTRTLYWSNQDPSSAGPAQLKAKSVAIEAVRVVADDNPLPPGLHRKSLIVLTPGRTIKFTAPTSQRHETWFNSLSYLLLRTTTERDDDLTPEEVDEFNPGGYGRSASRTTGRSRASLSSYNSRATRASSPHLATLKARQSTVTAHRVSKAANTGSVSSRFSSFGTMLRNPGTIRGSLSSRYSRAAAPEGSDIYDASVMHDSMEDLRQVIEKQEREADRLENVRACCDGKHDVGSLSRASRHGSFVSRTSRHSGTTHRHHSHTRSVPSVDGRQAQAGA